MLSWGSNDIKFRTSNENRFFTCIENLSNELLYEIFDYLDGRELLYAFSNLNKRFENLIMDPMFSLKFHHCTSRKQSFEQDYQEIIMPNKYRTISLHLWNRSQLIIFHAIDSSFYRLESLILHGIKFYEIISLLPRLVNLPHLSSLNIEFDDMLNDSCTVYGFIFCLPLLKYNKLSARRIVLQDSILNTPLNGKSTSIEKLIIDHPCTLLRLYDILSNTPKIHCLTCENLFPLYENIPHEIQLNIFNLTYCSISLCYLKFDEFEIFIKKISSQLRFLRFNPHSDIAYLDANRWEQLITKHIPNLTQFQYKYHENISCNYEIQWYHSYISQFLSSFWIEKRWLLNIQIDLNHWPPIEIIFSIQPKKNQWEDINSILSEHEFINILKPACVLIVHGCRIIHSNEWFIEYLRFISSLAKITTLHIELEYFSIEILIQFLHLLPYLDSLTLTIIVSNQIKKFTQDEINMIHEISNRNQITRMNLEQIVELNYIDILIDLCPRIEYLAIRCKDYSQLESIIRLLFMKENSNLRLLAFSILETDNHIIENLKRMISFGKFRIHYKIQRHYDKIYLQWKKL